MSPVQLALRTSVSSTSVTVIAPGVGCSITSTTTVSTTGATGCFTFRTAFFTDARLGLALATTRFAVLATLRALPRLAEVALRSLARLCTFDPFLRLAMIDPLDWLLCVTSYPQDIADQMTNGSLGNLSNEFLNQLERHRVSVRENMAIPVNTISETGALHDADRKHPESGQIKFVYRHFRLETCSANVARYQCHGRTIPDQNCACAQVT